VLKFDVVPHKDATNRNLARLIEAMANALAYVVEALPSQARAYHHSGMWDRDTLAAFGCVEALVHTGDIAAGLQLEFAPPDEVCRRVVKRAFSGAPQHGDAWAVLWWATGRGDLEGHARLGADWLVYWVRQQRYV